MLKRELLLDIQAAEVAEAERCRTGTRPRGHVAAVLLLMLLLHRSRRSHAVAEAASVTASTSRMSLKSPEGA